MKYEINVKIMVFDFFPKNKINRLRNVIVYNFYQKTFFSSYSERAYRI